MYSFFSFGVFYCIHKRSGLWATKKEEEVRAKPNGAKALKKRMNLPGEQVVSSFSGNDKEQLNITP